MMKPLPKTLSTPPTIHGLPFVGNATSLMTRTGLSVAFLQKIQQQYGDIVHFRVMNRPFYFVSDPDLVREILVEQVKIFQKPDAIAKSPRGLARFLGDSILTARYETWRPQRKLIQPLMHTRYIERYAETMAAMGERLLERWSDGQQRDVHEDMTLVTMWIIADTMLGIQLEDETQLASVVDEVQGIVIQDFASFIPGWLTGRDAKTDKLNDFMTQLVRQFIEDYRQNADTERHDLLSLLLNTRDEEGQPLSEEFLRNNILTMFFAGHETTANTLTWALYYLAHNPQVLAQLEAEVDAVLDGGRSPGLADLPNLPYTMMVIKETMRIQPTVGTFPRVVAEDTTLGGYAFPRESITLISPYVMHHDERFWSTPDVFDPERFSAEREGQIGKYNYLPFGGGPRICIGNHFALMEAQILLAQVIRHFRLHLVPGPKLEVVRQVTTYPRHGLTMRLEQRPL